jgi:hypothetical protein
MTDTYDDTPVRTEVAEMLAGVDQGKANFLMQAFDHAAGETQAQYSEAMWAIAMLQARVLALAELGPTQIWAAERFAEMVRLALPAVMLQQEKQRRQASGGLSHYA